jgi:hypothetical protein
MVVLPYSGRRPLLLRPASPALATAGLPCPGHRWISHAKHTARLLHAPPPASLQNAPPPSPSLLRVVALSCCALLDLPCSTPPATSALAYSGPPLLCAVGHLCSSELVALGRARHSSCACRGRSGEERRRQSDWYRAARAGVGRGSAMWPE